MDEDVGQVIQLVEAAVTLGKLLSQRGEFTGLTAAQVHWKGVWFAKVIVATDRLEHAVADYLLVDGKDDAHTPAVRSPG